MLTGSNGSTEAGIVIRFEFGQSLSSISPLNDLSLQGNVFGTPYMHMCILVAAYVRAMDRQNIAHGAPFVLKRYVTGVGGTYFVLVLLYLRYPLAIYPSCDPRVRVRHPLLLLCNRRAVSAITAGQLKTELAEFAAEIVRRSGVTLFRYGEQFLVL